MANALKLILRTHQELFDQVKKLRSKQATPWCARLARVKDPAAGLLTLFTDITKSKAVEFKL